MNPPHSSKSAGAFLRILAWPSALALGALAAFLYSLKQVNPEVRIVIDAWSWIIFGLGSAAAWFVMRKVFRLAEAADQQQAEGQGQEAPFRVSRLAGMLYLVAIVGVITVAAFIHALRDVSWAKRWDVIIGTGSALVFIAVALYFFWRVVKFLEKHGQPPPGEHGNDEDDPSHR